jgi:hypothetical protein
MPPSSPARAVRVAASADGTRFAIIPPAGGALLFDDGDAAPTLVDTRGAPLRAAAVGGGGGPFAGVAEDGALFVVVR